MPASSVSLNSRGSSRRLRFARNNIHISRMESPIYANFRFCSTLSLLNCNICRDKSGWERTNRTKIDGISKFCFFLSLEWKLKLISWCRSNENSTTTRRLVLVALSLVPIVVEIWCTKISWWHFWNYFRVPNSIVTVMTLPSTKDFCNFYFQVRPTSGAQTRKKFGLDTKLHFFRLIQRAFIKPNYLCIS